MEHWAEAYVGKPWRDGRFECSDLVIEVERDVFGRRLTLPRHGPTVRSRDACVAAGLDGEIAVPVNPADAIEGDAVLMRAAGRSRILGHHIGVWCAPGGAPHVLHCLRGVGACLHAIRALAAHGLELGGVYRWIV